MRVSKIKIVNFRVLRNFESSLNRDFSVFVGRNNTGKTSIVAVLNRFLSGGRHFALSDFNCQFISDLCEAVLNDGVIPKPWGITLHLVISYDENDDISSLYPALLDLDPGNNSVVLQFSYVLTEGSMQKLRTSFDAWCDDMECEKKTQERLNDFLKTEFTSFFNYSCDSVPMTVFEGGSFEDNVSRSIKPDEVDAMVAFKLIGVPRNVSNTESSESLSGLANRYFKATQGDIRSKEAISLNKALMQADDALTESYKTVFGGVTSSIRDFGGERPNETELVFKSLLRESDLLPGNISLMYRDLRSDAELPESHNGLGYLNLIGILIQVKTIASQLRRDAKPDKAPAAVNLLFIEEPEAHTHPQLQRVFMDNIKSLLDEESNGDSASPIVLQTMITTHSAHIVSSADLHDIKYLQREGNVVKVKDLRLMEAEYAKAKEPYDAWYRFLKQYLTLARADVFFADKLVLVEGDTERILLPAMMKKIDCENSKEGESVELMPLLSQDISVIEVGNNSRAFDPLIRFLGIRTLILTDSDYTKGSHGEACPYKEADKTSNYSLKHYLSGIRGFEEKPVEYLGEAQGIVLSPDPGGADSKWSLDPDGNVRVGTQGRVEVGGVVFHPRSFEDAFIFENREFLCKHKDKFASLDHPDLLANPNVDAYRAAEECVKSKSGFAIDVLLQSEADGDDPFANWTSPKYIEEGLKWLQLQ